MKAFKSIKWRLQIWYGLILVGVLAGFGLTAYQLARDQQIGRIDNELHHRVGILLNSLHRPPPHGPGPGQGFGFGVPPPDHPDYPGGDDRPGSPEDRPRHPFHLSPEDSHFFDDSDPHNYYFRIILPRAGGSAEMVNSTNCPEISLSNLPTNRPAADAGASTNFSPRNLPPPPAVTIAHYRQVIQALPSGETIEVGCSIAAEQRELELTALRLTLFGGGILLLGLAGGWWLVDRALRPVAEISAAAARISGSDLAQRINVAETESELGQLGNVLNSTFARLETAFAQQRQFTADAAHELRTPVTVILTQTQTTLNRERDAVGYRHALEACQRAAQRMRKLIESLLALARLEAGQEALNRQRFNLAETVQDSVTFLQPLASETRVSILAELQPIEINGDAERLAQVATNLLANAIQYNRTDGEVRLRLKSENGLAVLTVSDTGPGIPAAGRARVFERFYRADSSRTGSGNAGLGLSICHAIVTAHSGTIEVASEEKVGTTFTVRLPLAL